MGRLIRFLVGFPLPFLLLSLLHSFVPLPSFCPSFLPHLSSLLPSFLRFIVSFSSSRLYHPLTPRFVLVVTRIQVRFFFCTPRCKILITCFGLQFYAFEVNTLVFRSALALSPSLCEFELCPLLLVPTFFLTFTATSPTFAHIPSSLHLQVFGSYLFLHPLSLATSHLHPLPPLPPSPPFPPISTYTSTYSPLPFLSPSLPPPPPLSHPSSHLLHPPLSAFHFPLLNPTSANHHPPQIARNKLGLNEKAHEIAKADAAKEKAKKEKEGKKGGKS